MERKGSGFVKIISGYEFQINYNESKRPSVRSDRYEFTVAVSYTHLDVYKRQVIRRTKGESASLEDELKWCKCSYSG